jgi:hypothetical protein
VLLVITMMVARELVNRAYLALGEPADPAEPAESEDQG